MKDFKQCIHDWLLSILWGELMFILLAIATVSR